MNRLSVSVDPGVPHPELFAVDSNVYVSHPLYKLLKDELPSETSDIRRASSWPVERAFVYVDISDFSQFTPGQQTLVIKSLATMEVRGNAYYTRAAEDLEARLCIGDGFIYVFTEAQLAVSYAASLASQIELSVANNSVPTPFHFRIGVHIGPVHHFWDSGRQGWNYVGDGINGGQRVLEAIGKDSDDIVFVSDEVRNRLLADPALGFVTAAVDHLHNRGRRADKHGDMWRVYELNHTMLG